MIYRIVTYDKATERMRGTLPVPPALLAEIKRIARFQPQDDGLGDYHLDENQVREIARVLGFYPDPNGFHYYVEPYESVEEDGLQQPRVEDR